MLFFPVSCNKKNYCQVDKYMYTIHFSLDFSTLPALLNHVNTKPCSCFILNLNNMRRKQLKKTLGHGIYKNIKKKIEFNILGIVSYQFENC